ncbi:MAG: hypothetical protein PHF51_03080, partial [Candidatus ainarchaeum sp.]|nr:hypothetical protein [Candidatus ainarchaeum sp.]
MAMKPDMWEVIEKLTGRVPAVTFLWEFQALVERFLEREYKNVSEAERKDVAARIVDMYPIQKFMDDPCVEDIMINALNPIFVYDSRKGMIKTDERFESFEELEGFMRKLLLFSGKGELSRINDLHIPGGARANVVFSPFGPQITIRRFTQVPPSIIDLVEWGTL